MTETEKLTAEEIIGAVFDAGMCFDRSGAEAYLAARTVAVDTALTAWNTRPSVVPDREGVASEIVRAIEAYENSAIPESWDAAKTAAFNAADAILSLLASQEG